jgi:hypothetical protein
MYVISFSEARHVHSYLIIMIAIFEATGEFEYDYQDDDFDDEDNMLSDMKLNKEDISNDHIVSDPSNERIPLVKFSAHKFFGSANEKPQVECCTEPHIIMSPMTS